VVCGVLEVERDGLLGAVEPDEVARQPVHGGVVVPGEVSPAGSLDLDDAGAEIGELAGRERRGDGLLARHDDDPVEGKGGEGHRGIMPAVPCGPPVGARRDRCGRPPARPWM
jgi:hypothetical protein